MEKTYRFLDHTTPLPLEEIRRLYTGYWVLMVNVESTRADGILSGIPVVAGAQQYDGAEDGIYEKYKAPEYGKVMDKSFLTNKFITSLRAAGMQNV